MCVLLEERVVTVVSKTKDKAMETTELDEYQLWIDSVKSFKGSPDDRIELTWAVTGLTSEAGEVAGEVEKMLRKGETLDNRREKILDELGDVLWYSGAVCNALGISLDDVIEHNIEKINKRVYGSEVPV